MVSDANNAKFKLGIILITPGAADALNRANQHPSEFIQRHQSGDWGDLCTDDKQANDEAIKYEGDLDKQQRVLSAYKTFLGEKIYIISEFNRSSTTILLPEEY